MEIKKRDDNKPWSSEEMIEMSSKFARDVPEMDTVIPISYVRIIKNQIKEQEREKIKIKLKELSKTWDEVNLFYNRDFYNFIMDLVEGEKIK